MQLHSCRQRKLWQICTSHESLRGYGDSATNCTWKHLYYPDTLLAQEIPDLNYCAIFRDVCIDGEVSIHKPHLVLKTLGDTLDHVLQQTTSPIKQGMDCTMQNQCWLCQKHQNIRCML